MTSLGRDDDVKLVDAVQWCGESACVSLVRAADVRNQSVEYDVRVFGHRSKVLCQSDVECHLLTCRPSAYTHSSLPNISLLFLWRATRSTKCHDLGSVHLSVCPSVTVCMASLQADLTAKQTTINIASQLSFPRTKHETDPSNSGLNRRRHTNSSLLNNSKLLLAITLSDLLLAFYTNYAQVQKCHHFYFSVKK